MPHYDLPSTRAYRILRNTYRGFIMPTGKQSYILIYVTYRPLV